MREYQPRNAPKIQYKSRPRAAVVPGYWTREIFQYSRYAAFRDGAYSLNFTFVDRAQIPLHNVKPTDIVWPGRMKIGFAINACFHTFALLLLNQCATDMKLIQTQPKLFVFIIIWFRTELLIRYNLKNSTNK